ncbi:MAG: hypothetical protein WDW38_007788 [Sanguina aurantia]
MMVMGKRVVLGLQERELLAEQDAVIALEVGCAERAGVERGKETAIVVQGSGKAVAVVLVLVETVMDWVISVTVGPGLEGCHEDVSREVVGWEWVGVAVHGREGVVMGTDVVLRKRVVVGSEERELLATVEAVMALEVFGMWSTGGERGMKMASVGLGLVGVVAVVLDSVSEMVMDWVDRVTVGPSLERVESP